METEAENIKHKPDTHRPSRGHFIVVGAGFGGLSAAIELNSKGFDVDIFESAKELLPLGDLIAIGSSASRVIGTWGDALQRLLAESATPNGLNMFKSNGEHIMHAPMPEKFDGWPFYFIQRYRAQEILIDYAIQAGVNIHLNSRVTEYFEEDGYGGIAVDNERHLADGVIAADGIHSDGRKFVTGQQEDPQSSGFAIYRCSFPLDLLAKSPATKKFTEMTNDIYWTWIDTDKHYILLTNIKTRVATVLLTHKDTFDVEEGWNHPGDLQDLLSIVEGWEETVPAITKLIPPETLLDWKLIWRNPIRKWVSDRNRIVLLGDAAHPHLPSSGSGATQAIEDGGTLGTMLDKLGSENVDVAFKAYEKLRYERTSLTQRMGWETRHRLHQTDWDAVKRNPLFLKLPQPMWLVGSDARQYAITRLDEVVDSVKNGTLFVSKNLPEGYVHEDWTVEIMMAQEGKQVETAFYKVAI